MSWAIKTNLLSKIQGRFTIQNSFNPRPISDFSMLHVHIPAFYSSACMLLLRLITFFTVYSAPVQFEFSVVMVSSPSVDEVMCTLDRYYYNFLNHSNLLAPEGKCCCFFKPARYSSAGMHGRMVLNTITECRREHKIPSMKIAVGYQSLGVTFSPGWMHLKRLIDVVSTAESEGGGLQTCTEYRIGLHV